MVKDIFKLKKKHILYALFILTILSLCLYSCYSYYWAQGTITMESATITIPGFEPEINGSSNFNQTINLTNTITNNKNLAPGAEGTFNLNLDLSKVDYDATYTITYNNSNIPNNLKLYSDSSRTVELTTISGTVLSDASNQTVNNTIYWRWIYANDNDSNTNDSLYMNQSITIPFTVNITQVTD